MNYFTPELFVRLQECADPAEFQALNAEWERATQRYAQHLRKLLPRLNGSLRRVVSRGSLHDSQVLDIGTTKRRLTLLVQEDVVPMLLSLTYSLVDPPMIDRTALPEEYRSEDDLWLYDEIDIDAEWLYNPKLRIQKKKRSLPPPATDDGWRPVFLHSILLSNGWEIRLRFHKLTQTRTTSLLSQSATAPGSDTPV